MKAKEIESIVKNLEWYADKIREISKKQYDIFFEKYDLHSRDGANVLNSLAEVGRAAARIELEARCIRRNMELAEETDLPLLKKGVEVESEETEEHEPEEER